MPRSFNFLNPRLPVAEPNYTNRALSESAFPLRFAKQTQRHFELKTRLTSCAAAASLLASCAVSCAAVYNLKVVTDASPDYSDMPSMIRSTTAGWKIFEEKCWAMFYWNHIVCRQTAPMNLHGLAFTDPIRQFNDYGYTMCSTISGINCSI